MARDTFPYWPPTSPQRPAVIAGRQASVLLNVLYLEAQSPHQNGLEIPMSNRPLPRVRPPERPASPEQRNTGAYGMTLYDLFNMTETMTREQVAKAARGG